MSLLSFNLRNVLTIYVSSSTADGPTQIELPDELVSNLSLDGMPTDLDLFGTSLPMEPPKKKRVRRRTDPHAYKHRIMQVLVAALLNPG